MSLLCRYLGKGCQKAVENINTLIAPALKASCMNSAVGGSHHGWTAFVDAA